MNNQNQQPQEDPLQTLVSQVRMLDENVSEMLQSGTSAESVIEDYLCPIMHAMAVAVEQSFAAISQVAQTASIALVTSERTLASETLQQIGDNLSEAEGKLDEILNKIPAEFRKEIEDIHALVNDSLFTALPWVSGELDHDELEALDEDIDESSSEETEYDQSEENLDSESDNAIEVEVTEG